VAEWRFENAWVMRYEGPTLNATANEVAIETVEIAHEGLYLV
jgi:phage tail-like protein